MANDEKRELELLMEQREENLEDVALNIRKEMLELEEKRKRKVRETKLELVGSLIIVGYTCFMLWAI